MAEAIDWTTTTDAVAMLRHLAQLHPAPHRQACVALGTAWSSIPSMASLAVEQRGWLEWRRFNGRSVFHFHSLAGIVAARLRAAPADATAIADALRRVIPEPGVFRPRAHTGEPNEGEARFAPGAQVRLPDGTVRAVLVVLGGGTSDAPYQYELEGELAALRDERDLAPVDPPLTRR